MLSLLLSASLLLGQAVLPTLAFDVSSNNNVALYWGQSSAGYEDGLAAYCQDASPDIIILSFLASYGGGSLTYNVGGCGGGMDSPCPNIGADIKACQANGKAVVISLGGGGATGRLNGDDDGRQTADMLWNSLLGGSGSRPFGDAVIDGIDLDIENNDPTGYAAMISQLQNHFAGASQKFYITSAPQCVYPDASLGAVLDAVPMDMVFIQFYNNYCGVNHLDQFNYGTWDTWAKSSPNPNVKLYIGAPASYGAAGDGYVDSGALSALAMSVKNQYSSFGGVMFWDASQAWANNRIDLAVKGGMGGSTGAAIPSSPKPKSSSTKSDAPKSTGKPDSPKAPKNVAGGDTEGSDTTTTTTTTTTNNSPPSCCNSLNTYSTDNIYWGGNCASHNGKTYYAKWWAQGTEPGSDQPAEYQMWVDVSDGHCPSKRSPSASSQLKPKHRRGGDHRRSRLIQRGHSS